MIIYKITNLINGKVYIGQTIRDMQKRFLEHCNPNRYPSAICQSIVKYGKENFTIEGIDRANDYDELNKKEIYWIEFFNSVRNGYNSTFGGYGAEITEETRIKLIKSHLGKKQSPELIAKRAAAKNKKVYQYDLFGNFIKSYISVNQASFMTDIHEESVGSCARGVQKSAGNFKWFYSYKGEKIEVIYYRVTNCLTGAQTNHISLSAAANHYNQSTSGFDRALKLKTINRNNLRIEKLNSLNH